MSDQINLVNMEPLNKALSRAAAHVKTETRKVVKRAGVEVKRDAVKRVRAGLSARGYQGGGSHLPHYPRTISFELDQGGLAVEIGPDKSQPQGGMGRGVEFGSSKAGPIPHMLPAADAQEPKFHQFLKTVADEAL